MSEDKRRDYLESAEKFLDTLEPARNDWARYQ